MTIMEQELMSAPEVVKNCYEENQEVVKSIASAVKSAGIDNIVTGARGTSHHAAICFKFFAELLSGLSVSHFYPSVNNVYGAKMNYKKTLFVAVSQSGGSPDPLNMLKGAKANGALTVAITNNRSCPLCDSADFSLYLAAGEEKAVAATKTFTTEVTALLMLAEAIGGKKVFDLSIIEKLSALKENLNKISTVSKTLVNAPSIVSLSRGTTQGVAVELGLKIIETCYKFTLATSSNEFCHGPQALINNGTPVILIAPNGACGESYIEAAERLLSQGAFVVALTDIPEVKEKASICFDMPSCNQFEAPIVYAMAIQALACYLSEALGLSPTLQGT
jgi:glucosamine--fructose-6-phosphate aminotransferase (isomerizing)